MSRELDIFQRASSTFFFSSQFFPAAIKKDVFDLYSFVRTADDYVDCIPADREGFYRMRRLWTEACADPNFETAKKASDTADVRAVKNMLRLAKKHKFELAWIESFLDAMQSDLSHQPSKTLNDTLRYMYGSAEAVGLMMAKIMGLKPAAYKAAKLQGRALQYLNFIRDIEEDINLNRQYFPASDLKMFNLQNLTKHTAATQPADFAKFIRYQLERYEKWQQEASDGYKYIPDNLLAPLQTAVDIYRKTAKDIWLNPAIIYKKKTKLQQLHASI